MSLFGRRISGLVAALAVLTGLAVAMPAVAANLLSATVTISSTSNPNALPGYVNYAIGPQAVSPPANLNGTGCDQPAPELVGCAFSFTLSATGFSFQQSCPSALPMEFDCHTPLVTVALTNMTFENGEILNNALLSTSPHFNWDPSAGVVDPDNVQFTPNSVTLTIQPFDSYCGGTVTHTVSFQTEAAPPSSDVPEPSSLILVGAGLAGLAAWRRRRQA